MMALVFMLPENKPPFMGIKFDTRNEAEQLNKFWPRVKNDWEIKIVIEGVRILVTLLKNKPLYNTTSHTYTIYEWSKSELNSFLKACNGVRTINFGHVYKSENGDVKLAAWAEDGQRWFVHVNNIELFKR